LLVAGFAGLLVAVHLALLRLALLAALALLLPALLAGLRLVLMLLLLILLARRVVLVRHVILQFGLYQPNQKMKFTGRRSGNPLSSLCFKHFSLPRFPACLVSRLQYGAGFDPRGTRS
jgi:hypothetical protein